VKAVFRAGKVRRFPQRQAAHEHRAARAQNPAHFRERGSRIGQEMSHADGEDAIEGVIGEGHTPGRAEVEAGPPAATRAALKREASSTIVGEMSMPV